MISVSVRGIAHIGRLLGKGDNTVFLPQGSRLSELLDLLAEKYGRPFEDTLYTGQGKELNKHTRLLLNGQDIAFLNGLDTVLKEGDHFSIIPPVGGG